MLNSIRGESKFLMVNILRVYSCSIRIFQFIKCCLICLFLLFVPLQGSWLQFQSKSYFSCKTLCNLEILSYTSVHFRVCRERNIVTASTETCCTGNNGINKKLQWKYYRNYVFWLSSASHSIMLFIPWNSEDTA
jgi:hypothetical protein